MNHHKNKHNNGLSAKNNERNPDPKEIARRAYDLYLERGSNPGHDGEDWLQAERELTKRDALATSH